MIVVRVGYERCLQYCTPFYSWKTGMKTATLNSHFTLHDFEGVGIWCWHHCSQSFWYFGCGSFLLLPLLLSFCISFLYGEYSHICSVHVGLEPGFSKVIEHYLYLIISACNVYWCWSVVSKNVFIVSVTKKKLSSFAIFQYAHCFISCFSNNGKHRNV